MPLRQVYGRTQPIVSSVETLVSDPESSVTALSDWAELRSYTLAGSVLKTSSFEVKAIVVTYIAQSGSGNGATRVRLNGDVIRTINLDTTARTVEFSKSITDYSKGYVVAIDGNDGSANNFTMSGVTVEGVGIRTW